MCAACAGGNDESDFRQKLSWSAAGQVQARGGGRAGKKNPANLSFLGAADDHAHIRALVCALNSPNRFQPTSDPAFPSAFPSAYPPRSPNPPTFPSTYVSAARRRVSPGSAVVPILGLRVRRVRCKSPPTFPYQPYTRSSHVCASVGDLIVICKPAASL